MLKCQARASYRRHHVKTCHLNRIVYTPANRSQLQRLQQVALPWYPACISAEVFAGMTAVVELCSARSPSGSARRISNAAVLVASLERRLSPLAPASREDVLQRRTCSSCAVRARRLRAQGAERAYRPNAVQASFTRSFESMSVSRIWGPAEARDYAFAPARSGEHQCRADLSIVVQGERLHGRDPFIVRRVQVRAL